MKQSIPDMILREIKDMVPQRHIQALKELGPTQIHRRSFIGKFCVIRADSKRYI